MDEEVKKALITAGVITMAVLVTVPVALTVYDQELRLMLDRKSVQTIQ